ncbi:MAG: T9SS type A sorting domain-containing protein [Ignavibacteriales bacterium]|nr:T9SS type A sorting domain-containing protein [Ignavibacteriales bacterium]
MKDGTYQENVNVTKELYIMSENGYSSTTVVAANSGEDYVFEVLANNVTIDGFTTYGATAYWNSSGIALNGANFCTIKNNRCGLDATYQNWLGIILRHDSDNNTISNNIMNYNKCYGINIREGSDNNLVINNEMSNNGGGGHGGYGIQNCESSVSNIVRGNLIENNETWGVRIETAGINLGNNDINDMGNNTIRNNGSYDVYNKTSTTINAYYNKWGSNDGTTILTRVQRTNFNPWIEDPLPVEIQVFTASVKNNSVLLIWQTATEVNNYGFEIERLEIASLKSNIWEKIRFVSGNGNSNSPKLYEYLDRSVNSGKYLYRLKQIDIDGQFEYSETIEADLGIPSEFSLFQNYPNPFNPSTTIKYQIPDHIPNEIVTLKVFDILGNELATLVNETEQPGIHQVIFNGINNTSGVYYYRFSAGNFIETRKMILTK